MPGRGVGAQDGRPCYRPMQLPRYPKKKEKLKSTHDWLKRFGFQGPRVYRPKQNEEKYLPEKLLPLSVLAVREVSQPAMNSLKGEAVLLKLGNSMLLLHQSKHWQGK